MKWIEYLKVRGLIPVFDSLPSGVVPTDCPFYIPERDKCLKIAIKKGISAYTWPTYQSWSLPVLHQQ